MLRQSVMKIHHDFHIACKSCACAKTRNGVVTLLCISKQYLHCFAS